MVDCTCICPSQTDQVHHDNFWLKIRILIRSAKYAAESSGSGETILSDDEETGSGDGGILPRASGEGFFGEF